MKSSRILLLLAILIAAVAASLWWSHRNAATGPSQITVYYTKDNGTTEVPWTVSMRPRGAGESEAQYERGRVLYAATQSITGPASDVSALRFPAGTHLLSADVTGSTAYVDLSGQVKNQTDVTSETGEFKSLVWTLTSLPGIDRVAVRVEGQQLKTLPGGHLELDEPLRRSDF